MFLRDLLVKRCPVIAVAPSATVRFAAETMTDANVGCTVVIETSGLVGILTERDLVRRVLVEDRDIDATLVSEVMTRKLVVGRPDERIGDAALQMRVHHIRHLPVVGEAEGFLGVLSIRDLLHGEIRGLRDYMSQAGE